MTSKIFIRTKTIHLLKNNAHYRQVIKNDFHVDGRGGERGKGDRGKGRGRGRGDMSLTGPHKGALSHLSIRTYSRVPMKLFLFVYSQKLAQKCIYFLWKCDISLSSKINANEILGENIIVLTLYCVSSSRKGTFCTHKTRAEWADFSITMS